MSLTRRRRTAGSAGTRGLAASRLVRPAIAQYAPILIGFLVGALTGPSAALSIRLGRGDKWMVKQKNSAGSVRGRQIKIVVRNTQSDPNTAQKSIAHRKVLAASAERDGAYALALGNA